MKKPLLIKEGMKLRRKGWKETQWIEVVTPMTNEGTLMGIENELIERGEGEHMTYKVVRQEKPVHFMSGSFMGQRWLLSPGAANKVPKK